jgi:hypothetical protein
MDGVRRQVNKVGTSHVRKINKFMVNVDVIKGFLRVKGEQQL